MAKLGIVVYNGTEDIMGICKQVASAACSIVSPTDNFYLVTVEDQDKATLLRLIDRSDLQVRIVDQDQTGRLHL